jgi:hypothetical protein
VAASYVSCEGFITVLQQPCAGSVGVVMIPMRSGGTCLTSLTSQEEVGWEPDGPEPTPSLPGRLPS